MCNRKIPDFTEIIERVHDRSELAEILETVYRQGYHAGYIDAENQWWIDLEEDEEYQEEHQ